MNLILVLETPFCLRFRNNRIKLNKIHPIGFAKSNFYKEKDKHETILDGQDEESKEYVGKDIGEW
jgi:hypothetical protein